MASCRSSGFISPSRRSPSTWHSCAGRAGRLPRPGGPSSPNHVAQFASCDFFTVPTATFRVLFVFVVLSHARRRIVHVNVTAHPTAAWTGQQLREAFPWETAPRFLLRDRDSIYGAEVHRIVHGMSIEEVLTAPHAPWQNPFVERLIGSLRRECLDHVIVWNERSLRRYISQYLVYDPPRARQGRADLPSRPAASCRRDCRSHASWWPAPPLRAPRRLTSVKRHHLCNANVPSIPAGQPCAGGHATDSDRAR